MYTYCISYDNLPGFGIEIKRKGETIVRISSVFTNEKEARKFVSLCNSLELSPIHLEYVIQDVLVSKDSMIIV
ncbi:MAG: hypothetical protein IKU52_04490 [Clostridia bacterium]|nr:hypothetical protein [Clostridia bacterium]